MNDLWDLTTTTYIGYIGVSNYNLRPMEKTHFCILSSLVFLSSICNSQDYKYDDYTYDDYDYDEKYDYDNQKPEDYTDDYSQDSNDYYDQNLFAPTNIPPPPPIPSPTPPRPMGKMTFFLF